MSRPDRVPWRHAFRPACALIACASLACTGVQNGAGAASSADGGLSTDAGSIADGTAPAGDAAVVSALDTFLDASPARNVLWVGAHPDDETYAAPVLRELCNVRGARCFFLVVTDGGKGNCALGSGACGTPDKGGMPPGSIGAFRVQELKNSAAYFGAELGELALEDTPSATVKGDAENWNQTYSGTPNDTSIALIKQKFVDAMRLSKADVIVTFDPRHGVYCQPDHRAVGALAIRAATDIGFDLNRLLMVETTEVYVDADGQLTERAWVPGDPHLVSYDAESAGTWGARPTVMSFHKSQYVASAVTLVENLPIAARRVPLVAAGKALVDGGFPASDYDAVCASENAWWDGHGVCPKADGGVGPCW